MKLRTSLLALVALLLAPEAHAQPYDCSSFIETNYGTWKTDFSRCGVDPMEIISGGPAKDGIPAIDNPRIVAVHEAHYAPQNPVIALEINGEARAYPLEVLTWHEIANDTLGGEAITVTFCPLCNAAVVFARNYRGTLLDFGVSGRLRHSDMIMYDRQTETWWQQYGGLGLIGHYQGGKLSTIPSSIIAFADFQAEYPQGTVLVPNDDSIRPYGQNPYVGYDQSPRPFLFKGETPEGIPPLARVVVLDDIAFSFDYLANKGVVQHEEVMLTFEEGVNTALGNRLIAQSRDVGTVRVTQAGKPSDHHITFAFVVHAFEPDKPIVHLDE